jgi:hypothetical protein
MIETVHLAAGVTIDLDPEAGVATERDAEGNITLTRPLTDVERVRCEVNQQARQANAGAAAQAETLRQEMFSLTEDIIDWNQDARAFLASSGQYGAFDVPTRLALLSRVESALLASKALPVRTDPLADQERWMLQRCQESTDVVALIAALK